MRIGVEGILEVRADFDQLLPKLLLRLLIRPGELERSSGHLEVLASLMLQLRVGPVAAAVVGMHVPVSFEKSLLLVG